MKMMNKKFYAKRFFLNKTGTGSPDSFHALVKAVVPPSTKRVWIEAEFILVGERGSFSFYADDKEDIKTVRKVANALTEFADEAEKAHQYQEALEKEFKEDS